MFYPFQPIPKGNAKYHGNHLQKEIPDEKHVSGAEGIRATQFVFYTHF